MSTFVEDLAIENSVGLHAYCQAPQKVTKYEPGDINMNMNCIINVSAQQPCPTRIKIV